MSVPSYSIPNVSLTDVLNTRREAFAELRRLNALALSLTSAIEKLDEALLVTFDQHRQEQTTEAERSLKCLIKDVDQSLLQ